MIKANELRLGNYIQIGGSTMDTYQTYKPKKVCADLIKAIAEENEERGNDYILSVFQPLKLTPEILEKCGFERTKTHTDDDWVNGDYRLRQRVGAYSFYRDYKNEDLDYFADIKHLHQLQNLYFALTGIELEINL